MPWWNRLLRQIQTCDPCFPLVLNMESLEIFDLNSAQWGEFETAPCAFVALQHHSRKFDPIYFYFCLMMTFLCKHEINYLPSVRLYRRLISISEGISGHRRN